MKQLLYIVLFALSVNVQAHERDTTITTNAFAIESAVKKTSIKLEEFSRYKVASLGDVTIRNHRGEVKSTIKNIKGVLLKDVVDSTFIDVKKPKDYSEYYILLTASDGYKNVYSWNELYNNKLGEQVYIITEKDGQKASESKDCILVMCLSDINTGRRHLKNLARIEIKKAE